MRIFLRERPEIALSSLRLDLPVRQRELRQRGLQTGLGRVLLEWGNDKTVSSHSWGIVDFLMGPRQSLRIAISNVWRSKSTKELLELGFRQGPEKLLVGALPASIEEIFGRWEAERYFVWRVRPDEELDTVRPGPRSNTKMEEIIWQLAERGAGFMHCEPIRPSLEFIGRAEFLEKIWSRVQVGDGAD